MTVLLVEGSTFIICYVMCIFRLGGCNEAKSPTGAKDVLS
jgi:hypothetical protein